ncbi:MAG: histidine phosphatase family protein [Liquorilactobacillus ghanensis]|uniref:Phosphoglycerate mutase n=2 Tax=Liquorilactobacillus ghanensis TaxID=399370 RepID=A0A0R1VSC3_9LACO|nr:histidine phosphatase family protein [Liquorilactobacillus ghanensis]KRM04492.1 phosphoglycerate mutase [Liquorilactobacillus ghanensis DSM 18630]
MTVHFYLVRHGQTQLNRWHRLQGITDSPLTNKGQRSARKLGQQLQHVRFAAAYTSDLDRTLKTAKLILQENIQPQIPIFQEPRLRELSFGEYEEGKNRQVLPHFLQQLGPLNIWKAMYHHHHAMELTNLFHTIDQTSQIEDAQQLSQRINYFMEDLGERYASRPTESNVLIVAHALILSVFIESLNGKVPRLLIKNAHVYRVDYDNSQFKLLAIPTSKLKEGKKD